MKDSEAATGWIAWTCMCLAFGALIGGCLRNDKLHDDAVENEVGEYYINESHDKAFRWKTNHVEK